MNLRSADSLVSAELLSIFYIPPRYMYIHKKYDAEVRSNARAYISGIYYVRLNQLPYIQEYILIQVGL